MRGSHGKRLLAGATAALATAGLAVGVSGGSAAASSSYVWTPYNGTQQSTVNLDASSGISLIPDPQQNREDIFATTPAGHVAQFSGDGTTGISGYDISALAGGPSNATGSPSAIDDPQTGGLLAFVDTGSGGSSPGDLDELGRGASSLNWTNYDITNMTSGPQITGNPSAAVPNTNELNVAADSSNGDLYVYTRDASLNWTSTNVSSATNQTIVGDPYAFVDPAGYITVIADTSSGHLVNFFNEGGGWAVADFTAQYGGQTISGDPTAIQYNGNLVIYALSGSDLIQWTRDSTDSWTSVNLTTQNNGLGITSTPSAVVEPNGAIAVVAQGANEHVVEYEGSGSSFTSTDLTTDDGGPTAEAAPAVGYGSSTSNLAVWVASPANNLIELERSAAPAAAPAPTTTTASTPSTTTTTPTTTTVESSPTPAPAPTPKGKGKPKAQVKVKVATDWSWTRTISELHWIKMGKLKRGEGLSLVCRGTGKKKTTGCPYRKRSARGPAAVKQLIHESAKTRYRVGVVLTLTVSETGLRSEQAKFTIRSAKAPKVSR